VRVAGLSRIELMNSVLNRDDTKHEIVGLRLRDVHRCHVSLRQLDARQLAVDKYLVLDLSTDAALQSVLKQVCPPTSLRRSSVRSFIHSFIRPARRSVRYSLNSTGAVSS